MVFAGMHDGEDFPEAKYFHNERCCYGLYSLAKSEYSTTAVKTSRKKGVVSAQIEGQTST